MKKSILFTVLTFGILIFGFIQPKEEKLNFLFIIVDDLRPEIGTYGAKHIKSPNLDRFASQSAVFERSFCNIPVCGASRASLMSGIRPARFRFFNAEDVLNNHYPGAKSIPRAFHENGYTTISNGKIFHNKADEKNAWDEIWQAQSLNDLDYVSPLNQQLLATGKERKSGERGLPYEDVSTSDLDYRDGKMAQKIKTDLSKLKKSGKPFFLTMGVHKPHLPFNAPKKYWDLYDSTKIQLPANYSQPNTTPKVSYHNSGELRHYYSIPAKGLVPEPVAKKLIHGYYASVSYIDAQIGIVLDELARLGMDTNTVVIILGDHGWNLGDHQMWNKHSNFSSSLSTPLLLRIPNKTSGQRIKNIVEFVDIFPTLIELGNLPKSTNLHGESMVSLINKTKREKNFAISRWHDGWTIIKDQLYYTEWIDEKDNQTNRMLFDHQSDPLEMNNLAEKPEYASTISELSKQLKANRGEDFWLDRRIDK